ncbi:pyridoxamine 5'-phosphate oxidase [Neisseria gonorrhoeae]|uniref:Pyridoxamine 5'-phosphate oxidase n=1 Tax=Neisseria gonorrhoeae TaxID=485 RepID=A0A378VXT5_NEIGO|nr:pyridoxamine 5'-phosphate oxidase [Neisseria gonorrhoeae]
MGAWASAQSEVIPNKAVLVAKAAAVGLKHPLHVPRPPHWGGYIVIPDLIEFGRAGRAGCTTASNTVCWMAAGYASGCRLEQEKHMPSENRNQVSDGIFHGENTDGKFLCSERKARILFIPRNYDADGVNASEKNKFSGSLCCCTNRFLLVRS